MKFVKTYKLDESQLRVFPVKQLTDTIAKATAGITSDYFILNIDGGDPLYRERVYCYELYHQLRINWPDEAEYCLMGEVDKSAHPILKAFGFSGFLFTHPTFIPVLL